MTLGIKPAATTRFIVVVVTSGLSHCKFHPEKCSVSDCGPSNLPRGPTWRTSARSCFSMATCWRSPPATSRSGSSSCLTTCWSTARGSPGEPGNTWEPWGRMIRLAGDSCCACIYGSSIADAEQSRSPPKVVVRQKSESTKRRVFPVHLWSTSSGELANYAQIQPRRTINASAGV